MQVQSDSTASSASLSQWPQALRDELKKDYMLSLKEFLASELKKGKCIYPHGRDIFQALEETPFEKVRAVIIGQDPYHGPGQAHGMCFSVRPGIKAPPSLVNIFKELESDLGLKRPTSGYLLPWAHQGVLLLNAVLTVEDGKAGSHHGKGWEIFTDKIIQLLNARPDPMVFLLWGSPAQKKAAMVDTQRHLALKCPHPSPLSAHRGFLGCKHFSKANAWLKNHGQEPIDWRLP